MAIDKNDPGPAGGPGPYRTQAQRCAATRGARDAGRDQSRATRPPGICGPQINGGRPPGPTSPGHPNGLLPGAVVHTRGPSHNGTSGLWARTKELPCCRKGIAPKPRNAVIPTPIPAPIPVFQRSSRAAGTLLQRAPTRAPVHCRVLSQPGRVPTKFAGARSGFTQKHAGLHL